MRSFEFRFIYTCTNCRKKLLQGKEFIKLYDKCSLEKELYLKSCVAVQELEPHYLITKKFRSLCEMLDSGEHSISIGGPKGVGKSMALAAIATLCNKRRPCVLWSQATRVNVTFQDYINDLFREFGKCCVLCIGLSCTPTGQLRFTCASE